MPRSPTVSVVMSVFNGARYLSASIASILSQEDVDFELIIVDDGSTDATPGLLAEFAARDARVRVIRQDNSGITQALIRGCAAARGTFIARQDADDMSLPGRLKAQVQMLAGDDSLVFVSCWAEVIGPNGEVLLTHKRPDAPEAATRMLLDRIGGPPGHGSVMFRRDAYRRVGGYVPELCYAQDSDLWLRFGLIGRLQYVQEVLYQYRLAPDSISGSRHSLKMPFAQVVDELHTARLVGRSEAPILAKARQLPKHADTQDTTKSRGSEDATLYFIGKCLADRRDGRSLSYLLACVRTNPLNLRAWLVLPWALTLALTGRLGNSR